MKRTIAAILALAIVLVFALGAVALAGPLGGANGNLVSSANAGWDKAENGPVGQAQSGLVAAIHAGQFPEFANYGQLLLAGGINQRMCFGQNPCD